MTLLEMAAPTLAKWASGELHRKVTPDEICHVSNEVAVHLNCSYVIAVVLLKSGEWVRIPAHDLSELFQQPDLGTNPCALVVGTGIMKPQDVKCGG